MQAQPELHRRFRQEWLKGQAEDAFNTVDLSTSVSVPYGSFRGALRTEERTALEPKVLDNKYYVQGVGEVVEKSIKGPREILRLVDVVSRFAIERPYRRIWRVEQRPGGRRYVRVSGEHRDFSALSAPGEGRHRSPRIRLFGSTESGPPNSSRKMRTLPRSAHRA
jgi:hypothetical protein